MYIYDSLVIFVICFVYFVKRLEHLIKMDMALYKSYVLLLLLLISNVSRVKLLSSSALKKM